MFNICNMAWYYFYLIIGKANKFRIVLNVSSSIMNVVTTYLILQYNSQILDYIRKLKLYCKYFRHILYANITLLKHFVVHSSFWCFYLFVLCVFLLTQQIKKFSDVSNIYSITFTREVYNTKTWYVRYIY